MKIEYINEAQIGPDKRLLNFKDTSTSEEVFFSIEADSKQEMVFTGKIKRKKDQDERSQLLFFNTRNKEISIIFMEHNENGYYGQQGGTSKIKAGFLDPKSIERYFAIKRSKSKILDSDEMSGSSILDSKHQVRSVQREIEGNLILGRQAFSFQRESKSINKIYVVLPWINGKALNEYSYDELQSFKLVDRISSMDMVFKELKIFHDAGILHGDLKKRNMMLLPDAKGLHLIDFASIHRKGEEHGDYTKEYLPPSLKNLPPDVLSREYDFPDDIYTLGIGLGDFFPEFFTISPPTHFNNYFSINLNPEFLILLRTGSLEKDQVAVLNLFALVRDMISVDKSKRPTISQCIERLRNIHVPSAVAIVADEKSQVHTAEPVSKKVSETSEASTASETSGSDAKVNESEIKLLSTLVAELAKVDVSTDPKARDEAVLRFLNNDISYFPQLLTQKSTSISDVLAFLKLFKSDSPWVNQVGCILPLTTSLKLTQKGQFEELLSYFQGKPDLFLIKSKFSYQASLLDRTPAIAAAPKLSDSLPLTIYPQKDLELQKQNFSKAETDFLAL